MENFSEKIISGLKIVIDRDTCIATKNCIKTAPEVFELDEERICSFKKDLLEIESERLIEACEVCPVGALYVFDENENQIVP